jgi:hypothetical protein
VNHTIKENVKKEKDSFNCLFLIEEGRKRSGVAYLSLFAYNKE